MTLTLPLLRLFHMKDMIDLPANWRSAVVLHLHHDLNKTNVTLASLVRLINKKSWPPAAEVAEVEEHIPAEVEERIPAEEVGQSPAEEVGHSLVEEVDRILVEVVHLLHMGVAGPPS